MSGHDRLIVAEKPSLARSIASVLGFPDKKDGYIVAGGQAITWCYGHLLQQAPPDRYGWQQWKKADLPMIPGEWVFEPREDRQVKKQIRVIRDLSKKAKEIVHAGDPGREGQLLVDEILEYLGVNKPVKRIWLSATDKKSVQKALSSLEDNAAYQNLRDSALARAKADWLVGMNLTRAATLAAREKAGTDSTLSIGRVKTPTLAIVVARDREIENFRSRDYYVPTVRLGHANGVFDAAWIPGDTQKLDEQGRLVDRSVADGLCATASDREGSVVQATEKQASKKPDLPHKLSTLQKEAHTKYSIEPEKTLKIVQGLYERGVVSYPRTDCVYLPEEQFAGADRVLSALAGYGVGAENADSSIKSHAWDNAKVGEHHAIVPTGHTDKLGEKEIQVFEIIARGFVRQFYPDARYISQKVTVELAGETWRAAGNVVVDPGWTVVDGKIPGGVELPRKMSRKDSVKCKDAWVESKKTSPPSRFNKASILEAMSQVHKFAGEKYRRKLKETSGLGTEATRTHIVEDLVKREFLQNKGKKLSSTQKGRALIDSLPESLRDPGMTALWEDALEMIASGKLDQAEFLQRQTKSVSSLVDSTLRMDCGSFQNVQDSGKSKGGKKSKGNGKEPVKCPECGEKSLKRCKSKKGSFFWGCFNKEKHGDGNPVFRPDKGSKN